MPRHPLGDSRSTNVAGTPDEILVECGVTGVEAEAIYPLRVLSWPVSPPLVDGGGLEPPRVAPIIVGKPVDVTNEPIDARGIIHVLAPCGPNLLRFSVPLWLVPLPLELDVERPADVQRRYFAARPGVEHHGRLQQPLHAQDEGL